MSFNTVVPNAGQSPGIFPTQCNTNFSRLQALISGDHQFNNSVAQNDGKHKQVTYIDRVNPVAPLPTGTNIISFSKQVFDTISDLYTFNGNAIDQQSWRSLEGTKVVVVPTDAVISAVPTNCYGYVFMIKTSVSPPAISTAFFASNGTVMSIFANSPVNASSTVVVPVVAFSSAGLNIVATGVNGSGTYQYKIAYRKYA